jgi:uncharacterized DUF497 family protein
MKFSWGPKKAAANLKQHGVSFEEASTVFHDTLSITGPIQTILVRSSALSPLAIRVRIVFWSWHTPMKVTLFA